MVSEPRQGPQNTDLFIIKLDLAGALTTGVKSVPSSVFLAPFDLTLIRALAWVGTAPVGAALILNVSRITQAAGASANVYTTNGNRPTVADGATQSWTGSAAFVNPATPDTVDIKAGDILKLNIIQIGSGTAGSDLALRLLAEKA